MIWQGWFFYYFVATWILLNIWSIWGIVKFWDMVGGWVGGYVSRETGWVCMCPKGWVGMFAREWLFKGVFF